MPLTSKELFERLEKAGVRAQPHVIITETQELKELRESIRDFSRATEEAHKRAKHSKLNFR